ncbi:MAG: hypothetical protein ABW101_15350 [Candidatus Thiodiazotropha sp.]
MSVILITSDDEKCLNQKRLWVAARLTGCGEVGYDKSFTDETSAHTKWNGDRSMKIRSLLFLAGMLASATSSAAMVAFNYTALADGGGATIAGSFGYETTTPDSDPDTAVGVYVGAGYLNGTITGGAYGGQSFNFTNTYVEVLDNYQSFSGTYDDLYVGSSSDFNSNSYLELGSSDLNWLSGDALPTTLLPLSGYLYLDVILGDDFTGVSVNESYTLTSISAVPVPPAIWLFGSALAGFVGWSRRRQKA